MGHLAPETRSEPEDSGGCDLADSDSEDEETPEANLAGSSGANSQPEGGSGGPDQPEESDEGGSDEDGDGSERGSDRGSSGPEEGDEDEDDELEGSDVGSADVIYDV